MPVPQIRVVDVYPYRETTEDREFLLLRRSPEATYAGSWRMIGGKIEDGEAAWETGLRELREETGQTPERFWSIPSMNAFYEWQDDRVNLIPAFAAEMADDPTLDAEHDAFAWLAVDAATDRLRWPEQRRLLALADRMLQDGVPPSLVISTDGTAPKTNRAINLLDS